MKRMLCCDSSSPALLLSPVLLAQSPGKPSERRPRPPGPGRAAGLGTLVRRGRRARPRHAGTAASSSSSSSGVPRVRADAEARLPLRLVPGLHARQGPRGPRLSRGRRKRLAERFGIRRMPAWLVVTPELLFGGKQEGESDQATWIESFVESEEPGPSSGRSWTRRSDSRPTRPPRSPSAKRRSAAAGTRWRRSDSSASPTTRRPPPSFARGRSPTSPRSTSRHDASTKPRRR